MKKLTDVIKEMVSSHYPSRPASIREIREWEKRAGISLPDDIRLLYQMSNGCRFFRADDSPYTIVGLEKLGSTRRVMYSSGNPSLGPDSIFAFIRIFDGDFIGLDVQETVNQKYRFLDAFCETFFSEWRNPKVISNSLAELLQLIMHSSGDYFWLKSRARL